MARVLRNNRYMILFRGWSAIDQFSAVWTHAGLRTVDQIIWHKSYASSAWHTECRYESAAPILPKKLSIFVPHPSAAIRSPATWFLIPFPVRLPQPLTAAATMASKGGVTVRHLLFFVAEDGCCGDYRPYPPHNARRICSLIYDRRQIIRSFICDQISLICSLIHDNLFVDWI